MIDRLSLSQQADVATARTALNKATFTETPNEAATRAAVQALADAELALATLRASEFSKIQGSPNRLNDQQAATIRTQAGRGGPMVSYAVWNVAGYQADFPAVGNIWEGGRFSGGGGQIQERGNLTTGGNITVTDSAPNGRVHRVLATLPTSDADGPFLKQNDWNNYRVMARGNVMALYLNGHMISMTIDENPVMSRAKGIIALQIEGQGPVRYKNLWLREVKVEMGPTPTR
jgi:hypothetical protein